MPEGDTIHTLANAIRPRLRGATLVGGTLRDAPGHSLAGERVTDVSAHGKHLLIDFASGERLRSHLGMHGSWHRYAPGEAWRRPERQASIVLSTDRHVFVCFNAKEVALGSRRAFSQRGLLRELGPDLAADCVDFDAVLLRASRYASEHAGAPLIDLLLEQRVAAGIGNVYKSELLFLARLHPLREAYSVPAATIRSVYERGHELLRANQSGGPRVTRGTLRGGERERQAGELWVYRRGGEACFQCGTTLVRERLGRGHRSTYWCPQCQAAPPHPERTS